MQINTYSKAGDFKTGRGLRQVGTTEAHTVKKNGQSFTTYGAETTSTKAELSPRVQQMLDNPCIKVINGKSFKKKHCGPDTDLQSYAEKMYAMRSK